MTEWIVQRNEILYVLDSGTTCTVYIRPSGTVGKNTNSHMMIEWYVVGKN